MKVISVMIMLSALAAGPALSAGKDTPPRCDVTPVPYMGQLIDALSLRAVEAVNLAGGPSDAPLKRLIADTAPFTLGSGDASRPLGTGVTGARALRREMKADGFRFLGWDYIPTPVGDVCSRFEVTVEFSDSRRKLVFPVTFIFEAGQIVTAKGWTRSFRSGAMSP